MIRTCFRRLSINRTHGSTFSSVAVTSSMVKELREKSGAGMMDCKKALADGNVNGDINKAMDWLRSKGIARASSQASRSASEGAIAVFLDSTGKNATVMEVNSETGKCVFALLCLLACLVLVCISQLILMPVPCCI